MDIGGHVSTKGGIDKAIDNGMAIGATAIQVHPSPPQQWRPLTIDDGMVACYREKQARSSIASHFFHAAYLINLATDSPTQLKQSIGSLVQALDLAERLGVQGVVFHPGSHKGAGFAARIDQIGVAMREVLDRSESPAQLIVENSAGAGGGVGCTFHEVGAILAAAASPERVGVCVDTCHSFASGYDLRTPDTVAASVADFATHVGFDRLTLVHANDSRTGVGSNVDRHANVGEGFIGDDGFRAMLADERLRAVPWILETPGEGHGPTLAGVNHLRALAGLAPRPAPAPDGPRP